MSEAWEMAIFWSVFIIVCGWILRRFYFSKNAALLRRLRAAAGTLLIAVFVLLFFPWLPEAHGGPTGWGAILQGDVPMIILASLLGFTLATLFITSRPLLAKIGILAHFIAIIFLFGLMIYTFPVTVSLKFRDTAPIFAVLILLINNVILLLVWHQLPKARKHKI